MTNKELEQKISKAYEAATPNVLNAVLADCKKQKKEPIVTYNPMTNWGVKFAITTAAAILVILLAVGWNSWVGPVGPDTPTVPHLTNPPTGVQECTHTQTRMEGRKEPTCGAEGYSGDECCVDCGAKLRIGSVIPATGQHSFTPWITVPGGGSQGRWCENCLYEETRNPDLDGFPEDMMTDPGIVSYMQELFAPGVEEVNYFYQALLSYYNSPYEVDWGIFFEHGTVSQDPLTDTEKKALRDKGFNLEHDIRRLTRETIEDVLFDVYDHSYNYFIPELRKHFTYLGSTDCYYTGCGDGYIADVRVVGMKTFSNGLARVFYIFDGDVKGVVTLYSVHYSWNERPSWIVYSNHLLGTEPVLTDDVPAVFPTDLKKESQDVARYRALFDWTYGWYCQALGQEYLNTEEVLLREFFFNGFADESPVTAEERASLSLSEEEMMMDGVRLPAEKMDRVLQRVFFKPLDYFPESAFNGLHYLESTDCYYYFRNDACSTPVIEIVGVRSDTGGFGSDVLVYYIDRANQRFGVAIVVATATTRFILSNQYYRDGAWPEEVYVSPDPKYHVEIPDNLENDTMVLEKIQKLFGEEDWRNSWNLALCSIYEDPSYVSLENLFYNGTDERATMEERYELREKYHYFLMEGDTSRIDPMHLDAVLKQLFGITLEDLNPKAFYNIMYLESTGCYYVTHSDAMAASNFTPLGYRTLENGNIEVYYTAENVYPYSNGVLTLKPNGEGYRIVSNIYEAAT